MLQRISGNGQTRVISTRAFTLIELLVVIAIIGILSSVAVYGLNKAREEAQYAAARAEMVKLGELIDLAKGVSGKTIYEITGSGRSFFPCLYGRDIRNLPESDPCLVDNNRAMNLIIAETKGLMSLPVPYLDPWGSPYMINENEGEPWSGSGPPYCFTDNIESAGPDGITRNNDDIVYNVPHTICSPQRGGHVENQNWN